MEGASRGAADCRPYHPKKDPARPGPFILYYILQPHTVTDYMLQPFYPCSGTDRIRPTRISFCRSS